MHLSAIFVKVMSHTERRQLFSQFGRVNLPDCVEMGAHWNLCLQWLLGESKSCQACMPLGNTARGARPSSQGWKPNTASTTSPSSPWCCSGSSLLACFSSGRTPSSPLPTGPWISAAFTTRLWSACLCPVPFPRGGTSAVACTLVSTCTDVAIIQKIESR